MAETGVEGSSTTCQRRDYQVYRNKNGLLGSDYFKTSTQHWRIMQTKKGILKGGTKSYKCWTYFRLEVLRDCFLRLGLMTVTELSQRQYLSVEGLEAFILFLHTGRLLLELRSQARLSSLGSLQLVAEGRTTCVIHAQYYMSS